MSSVNVWPSGFANACTVTSRGMSCADTRAMHLTKTIRNTAAMRAARDTCLDYLVDVDPGQTTPWFCLVTGPIPL